MARGPLDHIKALFPGAFLRVFCAFAVGFVAIFHVCNTMLPLSPALAVVSDVASDESSSSTGDVSPEKCHICTVVSLPAAVTGDMPASLPARVLSVRVARLDSASLPATDPPPRTSI